MKPSNELLKILRSLPGKKVVTLSLSLDEEASDFVFDISEDGRIGYHRDHRKQLLSLLEHGIETQGGLIIRQFSSLSYEGQGKDGRSMRFPYKLIYAVMLGQGHYVPLSKAETENVCCTDARTGQRLKKERGVIYRGLRLPERTVPYGSSYRE